MELNNFKFKLTPIDHKVMAVNFDCGLTYDEITELLENETGWEPYGSYTGIENHRTDWQAYRYKLYEPKSVQLKKIIEYFRSPEFKSLWINTLYEKKHGFRNLWMMDPDVMYKSTECHGEFTRDMPGFENGIHCDYRLLVSTGMIYFTNEDNAAHATFFYSNPQRENPIQIPSNFCQGWVHANDWDTWHDGWNRTENVRYSVLLGLTIDLPARRIMHEIED